jgi:Protein kinase domain
MCSSYSEFYKASHVPDEWYEKFVDLDPQEKEHFGLHLPSRFVFLVLGVDGAVLAVHRVHRDIADPRREIIAFSGVEGALKCYTISGNLFKETVGRGNSIGQLKEKYEIKHAGGRSETSSSITGTAEVMDLSIQGQEDLTTPHAVLVPPSFVDKVLRGPIDPKSLLQLAETVEKEEKHGCFVNWVRRALTDESGGLIPCAAVRLEDDYVANFAKTQLKDDLPNYHPKRPSIDIVPLSLKVDTGTNVNDWRVVYELDSEEHIIFQWSHKGRKDSAFLDALKPKVDALLLADGDRSSDSPDSSQLAPAIDIEKLSWTVKGWHGGSLDWAKYAFELADQRPPLNGMIQSEMFVQQVVFSPIVLLLLSFRPTLYCGGNDIISGDFLVQGEETLPMKIKPDGGIKVGVNNNYLLCMMELSNEPSINKDDMSKSVLLTAMSALAFRKAGFRDTIYVPFILGSCETAFLFVTVLSKESDIPDVQLVSSGNFDYPASRTRFCTYLVALLDLVANVVNTPAWEKMECRLGLKDPPSGNAFDYTIRSESGQSPSTATPAEHAMSLAFALGVYDLQNKSQYIDSPYMFFGAYQNLSVVLKIWRAGDERSDLERIESEIELLTMARHEGVPCPSVVNDLTMLDRDFDQERYHVLAMTRLAHDYLKPEDVRAFTESLVKSVVSLHKAGILHCDIKPENVVWEAATKVASLVNFGHAQKEEGSRSYMGTFAYCSHRVLNGEPHSRLTEGYSVGKTVLTIAEAKMLQAPLRQVIQLGEKLCSEELTLEDALTFWEHSATDSLKTQTKTSPPS